MRHFPLLVSVLVVVVACGPASDPSPAATTCTLRREEAADLDLAVAGAGTCPGGIQLELRVATGSPETPTWTTAQAAPVRVNGEWEIRNEAVTRTVVVENSGPEPVSLVGLEWSTHAAGLSLKANRLLQNGYQSWSFTGVLPIPRQVPEARGTAAHGGDNEDITAEIPGVSWWWSFIGDDAGQGLLVGANGGTILKTYVAVDRGEGLRLRIIQGVTGDALVLGPGESRSLDGLYLAWGDVNTQLEAYAAHVADLHPSFGDRHAALGGWGSWNIYYDQVTGALMREEAAWATEHLVQRGLNDFLLDDGYPIHWGDWRASPRFGVELDVLAAEQTAAGLRPAIWLAPFYVSVDDPIVRNHPDWFVHQPGGGLRVFQNFGPSYATLDASHPEARAHVVDSIRRLWDRGYRTFKIDFLFGGAVEGVRQHPMTGLESHSLWMQTIREAVPDAHLVGCGAPILPSVGWVDSMRIGPDIALILNPEPRFPYIAAAARHTAYRAFTDRWWSLDPDVVLLRGSVISDVEAWSAIVSAAMSGGNYLLGDGRQSSAERLAMALAPEILAMTRDGIAARPEDPLASADAQLLEGPIIAEAMGVDTAVPARWTKTSADGKRKWFAVFAWGDEPWKAELEFPEGTEEVLPADDGLSVTRRAISGKHTIEVPPHGARLFQH